MVQNTKKGAVEDMEKERKGSAKEEASRANASKSPQTKKPDTSSPRKAR